MRCSKCVGGRRGCFGIHFSHPGQRWRYNNVIFKRLWNLFTQFMAIVKNLLEMRSNSGTCQRGGQTARSSFIFFSYLGEKHKISLRKCWMDLISSGSVICWPAINIVHVCFYVEKKTLERKSFMQFRESMIPQANSNTKKIFCPTFFFMAQSQSTVLTKKFPPYLPTPISKYISSNK